MISHQPRQVLIWRQFLGSLAAAGTVVLLLTLANFRFGHDDLALGWDTPLYVGYLRFIATKGASTFLSSRGFYNVVYSLAGGSVDSFVSNPQQTEAWFPVFLAGLLVFLVGQLTWIGSQSIQTSIIASLFSVAWLAPYRLASDLHPALAGMTIFLCVLILASKGEKRTHWSRALIAGLMLLLAFTHAETAIFAAFVLSVSALFRMFVDREERRIANSLSWVLWPWVIIAPGVVALYYRLSLFTTSSPSLLSSAPPISWDKWVHTFIFFSPLVAMGIFSLMRKKQGIPRSSYASLMLMWSLSTIAIALASYPLASGRIFGDRSLVLFPIPLLCGHGSTLLLEKARSVQATLPRIHVRTVTTMVLVALALFTTLNNYSYSSGFLQVFISHNTYEELAWLSTNLGTNPKAIFVYDSLDPYAGALADHYDNWVQAVYGDHYSYLGNLDLLERGLETPFVTPSSVSFSNIYYDNLRANGVFDLPANSTEIIVIQDFFFGEPLPTYSLHSMREIYPGIFVLPVGSQPTGPIHLSAFYDLRGSSGRWYGIARSWAATPLVLEYYSTVDDPTAQASYLVPIQTAGERNVTISYLHGPVGGLQFDIDSAPVSTIQFQADPNVQNYTISVNFGSPGFHSISLIPLFQPPFSFIDVDYISVS